MMGVTAEHNNDVGTDAAQTATAKVHDTGKQDLEKVTDYAEEKEVDAKNMDQAMKMLLEEQNKEREREAELLKKLNSIKVNQADVSLIAEEFEISSDIAERRLKENDGDVAKTLRSLLD
eukprot:Nk52_evm53s914 gene=Nk52_evmTU53s914